MNKFIFALITIAIPALLVGSEMKKETIKLPEPNKKGTVSLEEALANRHSVRQYNDKSLTLAELSQLLWAGQGITRENRFRTAPSAGALYPLEIYVVVERVEGLKPGFYHYLPQGHKLEKLMEGNLIKTLAGAALGQEAILDCAVAFIVTGMISRTSVKYGERSERYVCIEVGHAGQNILLQATVLGLGVVPMGAFYDDKIKKEFKISAEPYYIIPVGRI